METGTNALLNHHLEDLRNSGLSDATIDAMGVYSETNHSKILAILNRRTIPKRVGTALVFQFRDEHGELNGYKRLKFDAPRKDRNGKPIKYESPVGERNRVYIPKGTLSVLTDTKTELIITEGEKKAAKADQDGFPCIGLVGVFGWKDGKSERLLPHLETIEWKDRRVYIVFDSDLNEKPEIRDAESRLAAQLKYRGARVLVGRLPDGPDGAKQGIDDFLISYSKTAFREILDKAEEPTAVDSGIVKIAANLIDPMPEARRFLKRAASADGVCVLRCHRGEFWAHDGKRYRAYTDDELCGQLIKYLDHVCTHITKSVVANIMACIRAETMLRSHIDPPCWLTGKPTHRSYIAMQNGILDIAAFLANESDVMLPHSPLWFSPVCLPYSFDAEADCPKWQAFLDRNLEGDTERTAVLQEWFGYSITTDTSLQKFLVLEGEVEIPVRGKGEGMIAGAEQGFRHVVVLAGGRSDLEDDWPAGDVDGERVFGILVAPRNGDLTRALGDASGVDPVQHQAGAAEG
ncbi:MAG: DUF3854 domain-containing protein, partial [Planctomycetes bacterium]|nr:DUF3854 domain-containing protein [Planctomycetota bacterium]